MRTRLCAYARAAFCRQLTVLTWLPASLLLLQLLKMCERYVKAFGVTPHDDLRGESFLKPATKMWARAILELILPNEEEGGGLNSRWGAGPMKK